MRLFILRHGYSGDETEFIRLLANGYNVIHATPLKDSIYYILKK